MIAGVILAGGRATRMGGGDKGLLPLGGRPILAHVIERLAPQVGRAGAERQRRPGPLRRLRPAGAARRRRRAIAGPLAGVLAGLDWAAAEGAEAIVTAAADTPFFPRDLAARLAARGRGRGRAARDGGDPARRPTGTRPSASGRSRCATTCGRRSARACARSSPGPSRTAAPAPTSRDAEAFFNVNTPEDLDAGPRRCWRPRGHEALRRHRLEELRQDRAGRAAGRRDHRPRLHGLDAEARPPRLRRRPAGQGQPPPPRRRRARRCSSPRARAGR